jgi:hypothetical protein
MAVVTIGTIKYSDHASAAGGLEIMTVAGDCSGSYPIIRVAVSNPSAVSVDSQIILSLYEQYAPGDSFDLVDQESVPITLKPGETKNLEHIFQWFADSKSKLEVAAGETRTPPFGPCYVFETPAPTPKATPTTSPSPTPPPVIDGAVSSTPSPVKPIPTESLVITPASLPIAGGDPGVGQVNFRFLMMIVGTPFVVLGLTLYYLGLRQPR